jgi:hypothetical protein
MTDIKIEKTNSNINTENNIKYCLVICGGGGKTILFQGN